MALKTKTENYYSAHNRWVSARKHQCKTAITAMCFVGLSWELHCQWQLDRALERTIDGETKGLITPLPRWVSAQLLYVWVSARRCSQNLLRPFLRVSLFNYLHNAEQFFSYQECNQLGVRKFIATWISLHLPFPILSTCSSNGLYQHYSSAHIHKLTHGTLQKHLHSRWPCYRGTARAVWFDALHQWLSCPVQQRKFQCYHHRQ